MKVGALGGIAFEVSDKLIRTFGEFSRTAPSRWAVHNVLGGPPVAEFIGPGQKEISLPITLSALFLDGGTIEDELSAIEEMAGTGQVSTLIIGDNVIGKYYIDSVGETVSHFGGRGEFTWAQVTLSLKHYEERTS
jgi:phage protein U